ncbi:MAG: hypothetical protein AAGJ18_10445 [Bacteroidota bacterium]
MPKQDFFIGWQKDMPLRSKQLIRALLLACGVGFLFLAFTLVKFSKPFNNHRFELGQVKTFTGILYTTPFPVLVLDEGQSPIEGTNEALLVGYGKNGAMTFIRPVEEKQGSLQGKSVKLAGTLIYGDGKVLIELTKKEKSIIEIGPTVKAATTEPLGQTKVSGEILDPKCWFGVMKPGEGKVHKSCATRCISGGIPPVIRQQTAQGNDYYLLLGKNGEPINQAILPFVAEQITAEGSVYERNGWKYILCDVGAVNYLEL